MGFLRRDSDDDDGTALSDDDDDDDAAIAHLQWLFYPEPPNPPTPPVPPDRPPPLPCTLRLISTYDGLSLRLTFPLPVSLCFPMPHGLPDPPPPAHCLPAPSSCFPKPICFNPRLSSAEVGLLSPASLPLPPAKSVFSLSEGSYSAVGFGELEARLWPTNPIPSYTSTCDSLFPLLSSFLRLVPDPARFLGSALSLLDPCVSSVSFVFSSGTSSASVRLITAVCNLFSEVTRLASGLSASFSAFPQIRWNCRVAKIEMGNCLANLLRWICEIRLFTNALILSKDSFSGLPCLWLSFCCHYYSFVEIRFLSISPCGGKSFIAGNKIFVGVVSRLTLVSSKAPEVPLRDGSVINRLSIAMMVAEAKALALKNALFMALEAVFSFLQVFLDSQFLVICLLVSSIYLKSPLS